MNIYLPEDDLPNYSKSLKFAVYFISQINGWFITPSQNEATIYPQITSDDEMKILQKPNSEIVMSLPSKWVQRINSVLNFQDNPNENPTEERILFPILDRLSSEIRVKVNDHFKWKKRPFVYKMPWPSGKTFAVALTHDVDLTRKYGVKGLFKSLLKFDTDEFKQGFNEFISSENSYWTFPNLLKLYDQKNWKATFFFLARRREGISYRYNIHSQKFRQLFQNILDSNHEIGLHSSKFAFDYPRRIGYEKRKLENAIKLPVDGVRQHYLRLNFPEAFHNFEDAGLTYDSSCGFNEKLGFKTGTSFPFRPWNPNNSNYFNLVEVPFSIMDYAWIGQQDDDEANWEQFLSIAEDVKKVNGLLNILWHPSNLAENSFNNYWDRLITWLSEQDIYQDTLGGIVNWWKKREEIKLLDLSYHTQEITLNLWSQDSVENLTLGLYSPEKIYSGNSNMNVIESDGEFFVIIKKLNAGDNCLSLKYQ